MTAFKNLRRLFDSVIAMPLLKASRSWVFLFSLFKSSMWTISVLGQSCLDTEKLFTKTI